MSSKNSKIIMNELRVPPNDGDMEKGLLGCLIESPKEALSGFVSEHPGSRGYFYDLKNKEVYNAILKLQDNRQNIDLLTLTNQLKKEKFRLSPQPRSTHLSQSGNGRRW